MHYLTARICGMTAALVVTAAVPLRAHDTLDTRLTYNDSASVTSPNNGTCIAGAGRWLCVVWSDNRAGTYQVYFKRSSNQGATWSFDTAITEGPGDKANPTFVRDLSPDLGNEVIVFWEDHRMAESQIYIRRSDDTGVTWQAEQPASPPVTPPAQLTRVRPSTASARNTSVWHGSTSGTAIERSTTSSRPTLAGRGARTRA